MWKLESGKSLSQSCVTKENLKLEPHHGNFMSSRSFRYTAEPQRHKSLPKYQEVLENGSIRLYRRIFLRSRNLV